MKFKFLSTTALLSTLLLSVAVDANAQSQRVTQDGNCTVLRNYQRDGSYAQERRCITVGYGDTYVRNQQDVFRDLRRNERQFERGRITFNEYRRTQRRLNNDLERLDRQYMRDDRSVGGVAAYSQQGYPSNSTRIERRGNLETYWVGNCRVERTYLNNGTYSETRSCR